MMTLLWMILGLAGLVIVALALLYLKLLMATAQHNRRLSNLIEPIFKAIAEKSPQVPILIEECARNPVTRNYLYAQLLEAGQCKLFPWQYRTGEKIAESDMVTWLMHANELAAAPDEIELMQTLPLSEDGLTTHYYLFRFRTEPPHWAAERGWMAGITGPYAEVDGQALPVSNTFSELKPYGELTPEQHLEHLLAAIQSHAVARG